MQAKRTGALLGACFAISLCLILAVPAKAASVALTFDDGPSGKLTAKLLEILEQEDVPATFFLCGYRLEQYGEAAAALGPSEHELGIHGYSHGYMSKMTPAELREELEKTCLLIMEKTGRAPTLLRPPGGLSCSGVQEEAALEGYPIILWSVDPGDWRSGNTGRRIQARVLREAEDGDIILLHDMNKRTLDSLPGMIRGLKSRGFTFLTVSQLAETRGVTLEPGESYCRIEAAS
ncbi:MAG: polysaccharide deacetylase family protein [Oscillospiraceae bacterium]|nr:polysaccharide deacetylase family protein [Oscillospiraceae bacterium]